MVTASPAPALQQVSGGKTFSRVEEELSWRDAQRYCRLHSGDLADLQSMRSMSHLRALYSLTRRTEAWIGLFYDVRIRGPSWSSGSNFTAPKWSLLPIFKEGTCATLYSVSFLPVLGAASCTARKPFICYHGVFRASFWARASSRGCFSRASESERARVFQRITIIFALFATFLSVALAASSSVFHSQESIGEMDVNQGREKVKLGMFQFPLLLPMKGLGEEKNRRGGIGELWLRDPSASVQK